MTPLSLLDLVTYPEGGDVGEAFRASRELARHAERLGYSRYWIAEHHNLEGIASSATVVLMGYIAANTSTIRVGSGGIMLPNHAPIVVAEQVGTLESIYPGRIDLGLGRAPGTDPLTMRALRRHSTGADFDVNVAELLSYFAPAAPGQPCARSPAPASTCRCGSWDRASTARTSPRRSAGPTRSPRTSRPATCSRRSTSTAREFQPSAALDRPRTMVGVPIVAADTDAEAERLATSMYLRTLGILRGARAGLQPPVESMEGLWTRGEQLAVAERMALLVVGGRERVREGLEQILEATRADELILVSETWERSARLRSYAIIAEVAGLKARAAGA